MSNKVSRIMSILETIYHVMMWLWSLYYLWSEAAGHGPAPAGHGPAPVMSQLLL